MNELKDIIHKAEPWINSLRSTQRRKFEAIASTTATGLPTYEQLVMNGMMR